MRGKEHIARYLYIDQILRKDKFCTLEKIIAYVSDRMGTTFSKRTIQLDIQEMRYNTDLNLEAPIRVNAIGGQKGRKFYQYSDKSYSLRKKLAGYNMNLIEISDPKLADAVDAVLLEIEVQDALINVHHNGYNSLENLKSKMVETADAIDEYSDSHQNDFVESLKELVAMGLRELRKYDHNPTQQEEVHA